MHHKIGIIGRFGGNKDFCDGQTVKTRTLAMLLEKSGESSIMKVDTYYVTTNKAKLLLDTLLCLFTCNHVFLMVSVNGMRFYLPFLYFLNKITKRHIYHYIIGSELLDMIDQDERLIKYLNALEVNWFEYKGGTRYLRQRGVKNVETLANFKMIKPVENVIEYKDKEYRFCTFSRVMEEKGITDAIEAICEVNRTAGACVATLDIYGPVDDAYAEVFRKLLDENRAFVNYKGVIASDCSVDTLKEYYALLFPTHWVGEGVPGTIIDAFASGIPVIASDWKANRELIENGRQGYIYPNEIMSGLKEVILWSIHNPQKMAEMRRISRAEFDKYSPERIGKVILDELNNKEGD